MKLYSTFLPPVPFFNMLKHMYQVMCFTQLNILFFQTASIYVTMVRPEGVFKNRNRKPDLPKHNSGSCYRNRNMFFEIPVPVNPEPEVQILVPFPA